MFLLKLSVYNHISAAPCTQQSMYSDVLSNTEVPLKLVMSCINAMFHHYPLLRRIQTYESPVFFAPCFDSRTTLFNINLPHSHEIQYTPRTFTPNPPVASVPFSFWNVNHSDVTLLQKYTDFVADGVLI